jgi:hypothetical protein
MNSRRFRLIFRNAEPLKLFFKNVASQLGTRISMDYLTEERRLLQGSARLRDEWVLPIANKLDPERGLDPYALSPDIIFA